MPNRLADAASPYLRQHADNPVDWMPWGDAAFARARDEGKPVFLSVGYSSCHWCHVMAHESFEDEGTAAKLNESFVSIKLDREERPDVDEAYMAFVQLATGRGGWPMSLFLTPDRQPFYGGTYWPRTQFAAILDHLAGLWHDRPNDVQAEADRIGGELRRYFAARSPEPSGGLTPSLYASALQALAQEFDPAHGGFGRAPKFPPHTAIEMLLAFALSEFAADEERQAALAMAFVTLEKMVLGGIHDQVGGGFHRYSTDGEWLLPHFEKMLYDNALMLGNLARATAIAAEIDPVRAPLFAHAGGGIAAWLKREMTREDGTFYAALDADSLNEQGHHEEGAFYLWRYDELTPRFADAFGAHPEGNFRDEATGVPTGVNILHLQKDASSAYDAELGELLAKRAERPRPGLDDKVIVAWNGLMIGALAEAGLADLAIRPALVILEATQVFDRVPHQFAGGKVAGIGFLDDVAALADGLFKLADLLDGMERAEEGRFFRDQATQLGEEMIRDFEDPATGAFFSTTADHETLFGRTRPLIDQPIPSGNALALRVLVAMGEEDRARRLVGGVLGTMERAPTATEGLYAAALSLVEADDLTDRAKLLTPGVRLLQSEVKTDAHGRATITVAIELPEGLHINGPQPPARWLTPTRVVVSPLEAEVAYPPEDGVGYVGRIEIPVSVHLPEGDSGADLEIVVAYQPCTDQECLAPVERLLSAVVSR